MSMMPPRSPHLEGIPLNDTGLTVGKIPVRGTGLRVGMQTSGTLILMSPAKARRMAKQFDSQEARDAELDWVAAALRESADEIEAMPHPEQMRVVDQIWRTIDTQPASGESQ